MPAIPSATGAGITGSANPVIITVNGNKVVTANFTQNQYILTVNIAPHRLGVNHESP